MRCRDAKHWLAAQRNSHLIRPGEEDSPKHLSANAPRRESLPQQKQTDARTVAPPSRTYPGISTERIMQAVEQQRRITQQLEDLHAQQKRRTARLRPTGLKFVLSCSLSFGGLSALLVALFIFQPAALIRVLMLPGDVIAMLLAVADGIKAELTLIPSNSWLLSGMALVVVLMIGMWLYLMRSPREV